MLSSSPRIYIPPESDFIPRFFLKDPDSELTEQRIDSMLDVIFDRYRFGKEWQGERLHGQAAWEQMHRPTPAEFLNKLYGTYASQNGAVRWGDKTPIYASYVDLLHQIFPKAQFVHIIRDGRDVALSMLDKWGQIEIHVDLYFTARNWVRRINDIWDSASRLDKELYYQLSYESLVTDPEPELKEICEFLGETYLPQMARPQELGQARIRPDSFHAPVRNAPSTARIGCWRQEMSSEELRLFQHVAGGLLTKLGYGVQDVGPMTVMDRMRLSGYRAKYEFLQAGRRVAQSLGLVPPI